MSAAGMSALRWAPSTKLVGRGEPFHITAAPGTKFVPCTASEKAGAPAVADFGRSESTEGAGGVQGRQSPSAAPTVSTTVPLLSRGLSQSRNADSVPVEIV